MGFIKLLRIVRIAYYNLLLDGCIDQQYRLKIMNKISG